VFPTSRGRESSASSSAAHRIAHHTFITRPLTHAPRVPSNAMPNSDIDVGTVFWASLSAVLRVVALAAAGALLAHPRVVSPPILDRPGRKTLSQLLFRCLFPCLLATRIGRANLSGEPGSDSSSDPNRSNSFAGAAGAAVILLGVGALAGLLLRSVLQRWDLVPRSFRAGIVAACTFANSNSIPIALLGAISAAPQLLSDRDVVDALGDGGDGDTGVDPTEAAALVEEHGTQLIGIYLSVMNSLMWIVGFSLMELDAKYAADKLSDYERGAEMELGGNADAVGLLTPGASSPNTDSDSEIGGDEESGMGSGAALDIDADGQQHLAEGGERRDQLPASDSSQAGAWISGRRAAVAKQWHRLPPQVRFLLSKVLGPPQIGILVGVILGLSPGLQDLIFGSRQGGSAGAPLGFIGAAANALGSAAIPVAMMQLGASVVSGPGAPTAETSLPRAVIASVSTVRLLVMPLVGIGLAKLAVATGAIDSDEKVLQFVIMIESSTPSASNLVVISQLIGSGEDQMARLEFFEYVACIGTLVLWTFVFLSILS
jgi:predicted permease